VKEKDAELKKTNAKVARQEKMITELDITLLPSAWDQKGADISLNFELQKKLNPYLKSQEKSNEKLL